MVNHPARSNIYRESFAAEDTQTLLRLQNRNAAVITARTLMQNMPEAIRGAIFTAAINAAAGKPHKSAWEKSSEQEAYELLSLLLKP